MDNEPPGYYCVRECQGLQECIDQDDFEAPCICWELIYAAEDSETEMMVDADIRVEQEDKGG